MDAIYSTTAFRDHSREVKDAATKGLVRITENGKGAFVFCSDEVFQREIDEAVERALYIDRAQRAISDGQNALERGDVVKGTAIARAEVERLRSLHG